MNVDVKCRCGVDLAEAVCIPHYVAGQGIEALTSLAVNQAAEVERLRNLLNKRSFSHGEEIGELEHERDAAVIEQDRLMGLLKRSHRGVSSLDGTICSDHECWCD